MSLCLALISKSQLSLSLHPSLWFLLSFHWHFIWVFSVRFLKPSNHLLSLSGPLQAPPSSWLPVSLSVSFLSLSSTHTEPLINLWFQCLYWLFLLLGMWGFGDIIYGFRKKLGDWDFCGYIHGSFWHRHVNATVISACLMHCNHFSFESNSEFNWVWFLVVIGKWHGTIEKAKNCLLESYMLQVQWLNRFCLIFNLRVLLDTAFVLGFFISHKACMFLVWFVFCSLYREALIHSEWK